MRPLILAVESKLPGLLFKRDRTFLERLLLLFLASASGGRLGMESKGQLLCKRVHFAASKERKFSPHD